MSPPIALQLYTVRDEAERDLAGVLDRAARTGFLGVETVSLYGMQPKEFRQRLDDLGMQHTSAFVPIDDGLSHALDEQEEIGGSTAVINGFGPDSFNSLAAIHQAADDFNRAAQTVRERGMVLGYHNHWWEFTPTPQGTIPMHEFISLLDSDIFLLADIYWMQTAGIDMVATLQDLGPRIRHLHVKDGPCVKGEPHTAVGAGKVDIPGALAAVPHAKWHLVELDDCATDMFEAAESSYRYLTDHDLSQGAR